jgi:hypothetical protein
MRRSIPSSRDLLFRHAVVVLILISYLTSALGIVFVVPRSQTSESTSLADCCCPKDRCADGGCCCSDEETKSLPLRWVVPAFEQKCKNTPATGTLTFEPTVSVPISLSELILDREEKPLTETHFQFLSRSDVPQGPPPRG